MKSIPDKVYELYCTSQYQKQQRSYQSVQIIALFHEEQVNVWLAGQNFNISNFPLDYKRIISRAKTKQHVFHSLTSHIYLFWLLQLLTFIRHLRVGWIMLHSNHGLMSILKTYFTYRDSFSSLSKGKPLVCRLSIIVYICAMKKATRNILTTFI